MFKNLHILEQFFLHPTKDYGVRELARIVQKSPATVSKVLKDLAQQGFLKERKDRIYHLYRANLESELYRDLKVCHTIRAIRESGLLEALEDTYGDCSILLFGSCATGHDSSGSDIDLVVISDLKKEFPARKKYERILGKPIQLFVAKHVCDLKNPHLVNNAVNGITLRGSLEWISTNVSRKAMLGRFGLTDS